MKILSRFQVSNALAFDTPHLQTCNITELLMQVMKLIVIHRFKFMTAIEHVLKESMALGMHTGIMHFFAGKSAGGKKTLQVTKYVWTH